MSASSSSSSSTTPSSPAAGVGAYESLAHGLAGAGGGVISLGLTYPLYTVITKLQVRSSRYTGAWHAILCILREQGVRGFYSGVAPALVGNAYAQGVYYYWYSLLRRLVEGPPGRKKRNVGTLVSLLVGALAGAITVVFTNPFWVVTTRMQTRKETANDDVATTKNGNKNKNDGVLQVIREVYDQDGIAGFWSGLVPSLILVSNPSIQYMVFEQLKPVFLRILRRRQSPSSSSSIQLGPAHFFLLGAIAKTVATMVTYPYITVKTRLQAASSSGGQSIERYRSTIDVLQKIWKEEGVSGFYKGLNSKIVQSVLNAAFLFVAEEQLAKAILRMVLLLRSPQK
ncbi:Peroxisomal nicotinamide adenine dinucleotide carrier [Balamuthia mandrillaris]